ncbi:MAG TPA: hypothetical protein VIJ73_20100, partial [Methylomirabilota bacterium]
MPRPVRREKIASEVRGSLRLGPVTVDRHHVNLLAVGQTEQREGLERACRFPAPAVGHHYASGLRQLARDDNDGTGAATENL